MIGTLYSTNITPDPETGIGAWSDDEFVRALHEGVGKDGEHLYPAFPYTSYTLMTRSDALAIKAYLFSLKPIKYTPPPNDISFPFNQRYLMVFWNVLFNPEHRFQPQRRSAGRMESRRLSRRGARPLRRLPYAAQYSVWAEGHRKFAGAIIKAGRRTTSRPTPTGASALGPTRSSRAICLDGHADGRGSASGPMAEVVDNSLRLPKRRRHPCDGHLSEERSIQWQRYDDAAAPTPSLQQEVNPTILLSPFQRQLGLRVFEGACMVAMGSTVRVPSRTMLRCRAEEP